VVFEVNAVFCIKLNVFWLYGLKYKFSSNFSEVPYDLTVSSCNECISANTVFCETQAKHKYTAITLKL
jgi:hypothetical protein